MTFGYQYDFGSTTELMITVANYRVMNNRKEKLIILSRNNPIEILCEECGKKPVAYICTECFYEGSGWLCEDCAGLMSVERKCFCRFVIHREWESAAIAGVTYIRISL